MSTRNTVLAATLAASLAGCVDRGDWKPAPKLEPQALGAQQTLAGARLDAAAWPADLWWHAYGDPQLDARVAEAQAIAAGAARAPAAALDAEATRQRYPEHGLFPPPFAGSYSTDARMALDFSFDLDFWGRNRALLAAARSGVQAGDATASARRAAARSASPACTPERAAASRARLRPQKSRSKLKSSATRASVE